MTLFTKHRNFSLATIADGSELRLISIALTNRVGGQIKSY